MCRPANQRGNVTIATYIEIEASPIEKVQAIGRDLESIENTSMAAAQKHAVDSRYSSGRPMCSLSLLISGAGHLSAARQCFHQ